MSIPQAADAAKEDEEELGVLMQCAPHALSFDPRLRERRFELVPSTLTEHTFWRHYFLRVLRERRVLGLPPLRPAEPAAAAAAAVPASGATDDDAAELLRRQVGVRKGYDKIGRTDEMKRKHLCRMRWFDNDPTRHASSRQTATGCERSGPHEVPQGHLMCRRHGSDATGSHPLHTAVANGHTRAARALRAFLCSHSSAHRGQLNTWVCPAKRKAELLVAGPLSQGEPTDRGGGMWRRPV